MPTSKHTGQDEPATADATRDDSATAAPSVEDLQPGGALLAKLVRRRREFLTLTQDDVGDKGGPSVATLRALERGQSESYRTQTLKALDTVLAWPAGASATLLYGESRLDEKRQIRTRRTSDDDLCIETLDYTLTELETRLPSAPHKRRSSARYPVRRSGTQTHTPAQRAENTGRYDTILAALSALDADELDELGRFATNLARLYRFTGGSVTQNDLADRALQELQE